MNYACLNINSPSILFSFPGAEAERAKSDLGKIIPMCYDIQNLLPAKVEILCLDLPFLEGFVHLQDSQLVKGGFFCQDLLRTRIGTLPSRLIASQREAFLSRFDILERRLLLPRFKTLVRRDFLDKLKTSKSGSYHGAAVLSTYPPR